MLEQLAVQLHAVEDKPVEYSHPVPLLVLMSFLLTGWLIYFGIAQKVFWYFDPNPSLAATLEFVNENPSVDINPYTFDQNLNPDWNYVQGYGYPK